MKKRGGRNRLVIYKVSCGYPPQIILRFFSETCILTGKTVI